MNKVCREQFVALHSHPILEDLSQSFLHKFVHLPETEMSSEKDIEIEKRKREILFKKLPTKGELQLNVVKNSVYFFS